MESKPWKLHNFSKQRDENAISVEPTLLKSIHQRNKSTPALSSLASLKGINANPIRRAAFADISNQSRQPLPSADSNGKIVKIVQSDAKNFAPSKNSLRPAQRFLSNTAQSASSIAPLNSIAPSTRTSHISELQPVKPALIKRNTTIFREIDAPVPSRSEIIAELKSSVGASQPLQKNDENFVESAVAQSTVSAESTQSEEKPKEASKEASKETSKEASQETSCSSQLPESEPAILDIIQSLADSISEATEPLRPLDRNTSTVEHGIPLLPLPSQPSQDKFLDSFEPELYLPALEAQPILPTEVQPPLLDENKQPSTGSLKQGSLDAEEYWEEEDEEFFDAEGGVTARSIRSLGGDNTTGGVSIVMNPRVTARIERELIAAKVWVDNNTSADDIDDEAWDTTMVAEYGEEIFGYMRDLETRMMPNAYYIENQTEIEWSMRSVLIDWVVQVHQRFGLLPETLFLAVNCIDRFLSVKVVSLGKLQLVGATALYIAAKYEEINCPSVQEIAYMVDGSYTIDEILKAERFMLTMLKFEMGWPGPMSFLRRISKADDYEVETRTLAKYFLEVCLMDERFVSTLPSFLSAGSHCLARLMLQKGYWTQAHVHYSQYTFSQLRPLLLIMLECCERPRVHHAAIFEKYSNRQFKRASLFVETEISKGFDLPFPPNESIGALPSSWRRKLQQVTTTPTFANTLAPLF